MISAQARECIDRPKLNPDLARQFFGVLYFFFFREATRLAYIEVRGKRESDKVITFRRFYLSPDLLIRDMPQWPADHHYWFGVALRWSDAKGKKEHCLALDGDFSRRGLWQHRP